ncbi:MAG: mannitol dehydrogenase family protein, partial [Lachnospiraceae bacterium]|nr:mannitol dehydrogenase family protein [Lachnospiraceae bacterium]
FPNGRPPLEEAGVYMTDRETVNKSERMKVTVCLNPIHTALTTYDCMLGYDLFADGMDDPELHELARRIGYVEGLPVVPDPGILSPKAFLDECMNDRFPNKYMGDTSQRIATDISQMVGIRFGETIKAYVEKDGTAEGLVAEPLAITGFLRYMMAVDDNGEPFELAPDPMGEEMQAYMQSNFRLGHPEEVGDKLRPILTNANIFGIDLYEAGLGEKIEEMFREEIAGAGAVRATLKKYLTA